MSKTKNKSVELVFPDKGDADFGDRLMSLREFQVFDTPPLRPMTSVADYERNVERSCGGFEKAIYQHLMQHFLSRRSLYKSLLLYHFLGVGKSCSSITISEALLLDHTENEAPRIIVVSPSALRKNFEEELFASVKYLNLESVKNQCTGDTYRKLVHGIKKDVSSNSLVYRTTVVKRIQQLIKSRYQFVTYAGLIALNESGARMTDKVFIVDEAHNLRQNDASKASAEALRSIINKGKRNRLVLLSATPMYNEPDEIFWLLSLLLANDERKKESSKVENLHLFKNGEPVAASFQALQRLSTEYISYIRGNNPFTFPARLKPVPGSIPVLQEPWTNEMRDNIVVAEAGDMQQIHMLEPNLMEHDDEKSQNEDDVDVSESTSKSSVVKLQLSNITYPNGKSGSTGFYEMFSKVDDVKPVQVNYRNGQTSALVPSNELLGRIAAKIKQICDTIRTAEGIVVVYSQFVWSGIVPCAIALEHMGFKRFGARNMLTPSAIKSSITPAKYSGVVQPTYCVLSGSDAVMGSTRIEDMMNVLNNKNNIHGQQIKVVLMTPVAGEGLSFKNVREMHVLEPWYHFNKIEQVVGRAIRTCSHRLLPHEERNVTVYLHACVKKAATSRMLTPDIHAYKISARKLFETRRAEETIRDNAIDCDLLTNVNYYPRDLFQFAVTMHTSQNQHVPYIYGEDSLGSTCVHKKGKHVDARSMRPGIFEDLIPTLLVQLEKYISANIKTKSYFSVKELKDSLRRVTNDDTVVLTTLTRSLYPATLVSGYRIFPHMNGIVVVAHEKEKYNPVMVKLPNSVSQQNNNTDCDVAGIVKTIVAGNVNEYIGLYNAYLTVNSACWGALAKLLVTSTTSDATIVATLFGRTGALISSSEMPRLATNGNKYVGYVDIFDMKRFVVFVCDNIAGGVFREATDSEISILKDKRVHVPRPKTSDRLFGLIEPTQFKKLPNEPLTHQLKLIGTDPKTPTSRGAACNTKTKTEIEGFLKEVGVKDSDTKKIKEQLCFSLAIELMRNGRMFAYPEWKPRSS